MAAPDLSLVKIEPNDDEILTNKDDLIGYFLQNESSSRESIIDCYCKDKFLDDTDGKLKFYPQLCSNIKRVGLDGDYKNYCDKCYKQFSNPIALQKHYVFVHMNEAILNLPTTQTFTKPLDPNERNYDWLDEPLPLIQPKEKQKDPTNVIVLKKNPRNSIVLKKNLKTVILSQKKKIDLNCLQIPPKAKYERKEKMQAGIVYCNKNFTIENIKRNPQRGIRVVKKSEIKFRMNRFKWKSQSNQMSPTSKQKLQSNIHETIIPNPDFLDGSKLKFHPFGVTKRLFQLVSIKIPACSNSETNVEAIPDTTQAEKSLGLSDADGCRSKSEWEVTISSPKSSSAAPNQVISQEPPAQLDVTSTTVRDKRCIKLENPNAEAEATSKKKLRLQNNILTTASSMVQDKKKPKANATTENLKPVNQKNASIFNKCNVRTSNIKTFDNYVKQHKKLSFKCPICLKMIDTVHRGIIGIVTHTARCRELNKK